MIAKHALVHYGYANSSHWCLMITNWVELLQWEQSLFDQSAMRMLYGTGAWKGTDYGIDKLGKFEAKKKARWEQLLAAGTPILINRDGGWLYPSNDITITDIKYLEYPKLPSDKVSDIVVCENDPAPEDWFIQLLGVKYPNKSICVLTRFRDRNPQDVAQYFMNAEVISFTTTFTSTDWFEMALEAMIQHNIKNKTVFGNLSGGGSWKNSMPEKIQNKITYLTIFHNINFIENITA